MILREIEHRKLTEKLLGFLVVDACALNWIICTAQIYRFAPVLDSNNPFIPVLVPDYASKTFFAEGAPIGEALRTICNAEILVPVVKGFLWIAMVAVFAIAIRQAKNLAVQIDSALCSVLCSAGIKRSRAVALPSVPMKPRQFLKSMCANQRLQTPRKRDYAVVFRNWLSNLRPSCDASHAISIVLSTKECHANLHRAFCA